MINFDQPFSSQENPSGSVKGHSATQLFSSIESRTAYLMAQTKRAIGILLNVNPASENADQHLASSPELVNSLVTIDELERYAPQWAHLVPDDVNVQAQLISFFAQKYKLIYNRLPALRQALGVDSKAVQLAYQSHYNQPLTALFHVDTVDDERLKVTQTESKDDYSDIEAELEWIDLAKGDFLFRQGDIGDSLYLLVHGRLRVFLEQNGDFEQISEIGPGEIFGEMALITGEKRSATLIAVRDTSVFKLDKSGFERLIERRPQVMMQIARIQAERVRRLSDRQRGVKRTRKLKKTTASRTNLVTLAVVPISRDVPLTEFCQRLKVALSPYGQALHLNQQQVDDALEKGVAQSELDDADNSRVVAWLSEQEIKYRFVIYESDTSLSATPWTKRCVRQADQILLVGWANSNPELSEIEFLMQKEKREQPIASARQSLVLLHPNTNRPVGTSQWLNRRDIQRHHHLQWKSSSSEEAQAEFERLARLYTGNSIGLVLGSGGARGMAHIGALRAIEELGLKVDMVGGTSFGALIAGLYAIGLDYESLYHTAKEVINPKQMFDYTLPMTSFLGGKHLTKILQGLFGDIQIEDTWLEFFCVSSNLTQSIEVVHQQGPLWKYLRATCSLPVVLPPVVDNGDLLIDGGLVNPLPLDVMSRLCADGSVIGVDTGVQADLTTTYQFGASLSGWDVLKSRINPFRSKIDAPNMLLVVLRSLQFNSTRRNELDRNYADLYIRPPIEEFDLLDFDNYEAMVEVGYQSALSDLKAWLGMEGH